MVTGNGVSVAEREGENKRRGEKEAVQRGCGFKRESRGVWGTWLSGRERVGFQMYARSHRPFTLSRTRRVLSKWSWICVRLLSSFHSAFPLGMKQIMAKMSFLSKRSYSSWLHNVGESVCVCVPVRKCMCAYSGSH